MTQKARGAPGGGTERPAERGEAARALLGRVRYLTPGEPSDDGREVVRESSSRSEDFYRDRWRHDREVRTPILLTGSATLQLITQEFTPAVSARARSE